MTIFDPWAKLFEAASPGKYQNREVKQPTIVKDTSFHPTPKSSQRIAFAS